MTIPTGFCQCGCGSPTNLAARNNTKNRQKKGEPFKFLKGHNIAKIGQEQYAEDKNGCWIWQWSMVNTGYGKMWDGSKLVLAHRWYYEQKYGPIPEGKYLCHTCDVRACVNPDHVFVGTQKDNVQDMIKKGRDNNPRKLSDSDVRKIRKRLSSGESQTSISRSYDITQSTVSAINTRSKRFA